MKPSVGPAASAQHDGAQQAQQEVSASARPVAAQRQRQQDQPHAKASTGRAYWRAQGMGRWGWMDKIQKRSLETQTGGKSASVEVHARSKNPE
jgi:hypothetical protein